MDKHLHNVKRLMWFTPFKGLTLSTAYLVPFFTGAGLTQTEIFLLQAIFSFACVIWELPSGLVADKLGRANCIKWSAPVAALAMIAYGSSDHFWQFAICELLLAVANGLISGADTALLVDSLHAEGRSDQYVQVKQRLNALGFGSLTIGVPASAAVMWLWGVPATLVVDGVLVGIGTIFAWKLADVPHVADTDKAPAHTFKTTLAATQELLKNKPVRWLLALNASLGTATYLGFWLSAPYYQQLGIPLALFGTLFAARNLFKAWLSHQFHAERRFLGTMANFALLVALGYIAMASGQWWLAVCVLGLDIVHALLSPPIEKRINAYIASTHRATLNSVDALTKRMAFMVGGPLAGLAIDSFGFHSGLLIVGAVCASTSLLATVQLRRLKTQ